MFVKQIFIFLLVVIAAIACIPLLPLKTAVSIAHLEKFGFTASSIEGNLWSGRLYDAQFGKIPLGDVTTNMSIADLGKGRVRLAITGTDETTNLKGSFSYGLGGLGFEGFNMGMPAMGAAPPLGGLTIFVDDLNVRFPGGVCTDGTGSARAYVVGAAPGLGIPENISGPIICRDGLLVFDLASNSGAEREEITIVDAQSYRVRVTVQQSAPQIVNALLAKGFVSRPEGYVYEVERKL